MLTEEAEKHGLLPLTLRLLVIEARLEHLSQSVAGIGVMLDDDYQHDGPGGRGHSERYYHADNVLYGLWTAVEALDGEAHTDRTVYRYPPDLPVTVDQIDAHPPDPLYL